MPVAKVQLPDGRIAKFEVPEGTTPEQVMAFAAQTLGKPEPQAQPAAQDQGPGLFRGATDAAVRGFTFGLSDEVGAAGAATGDAIANLIQGKPMGWGDAYDANLAKQRKSLETFSNDSPWISGAANLIGGMGALGAGGKLLNPAPAATLSGRALQGAKVGSGIGAAYGFGEGEGGIPERLASTVQGGAVGGALGGAAPFVVEGGAAALRKMAQPIVERMGPADAAARRLARAMERDGLSADDLIRQARELGPEATIADAGGANVRGLGEVIAQSPGRGMEAAQVLQRRAEGQGQRIADSVNRGLSGRDIVAAGDDLIAQRSAAATPLYERSVNPANLIPDDRFAALAGDDFMAGLFQKVQGDPLLGMKNLPPNSMPVVDAVKKNIDDMISAAQRAGENNRARLLMQRKDALVQIADEAFPEYAAARAAFSGPSQSMDAMAIGRDFFKTDPRTLAQQVQQLSEGDREFLRAGVADKLKEMLAGTRDSADATRRIFGNDRIRQQLQAVFPDEQSFATFAKEMEREALFANNRNQMLGNSRTHFRNAAEADLAAESSDGVMGMLFSGRPIAAAGEGARKLFNAIRRPPESVREELAQLLFTQGNSGQALNALNQRAQAASLSAAQRAELAKMLAQGGGQIGGYSAGP
jgi:hypothetical protein